MPETCIVCLGDLSTGNGDVATSRPADAKSPTQHDVTAPSKTDEVEAMTRTFSNVTNNDASSLIAQIKECGHTFHQDCLAPWIERANSCPMCRASFHVVEVKDKIGGNVITTLKIEDRTQVAELDPTTLFEVVEDDDEFEQPCQGCGEEDNEDVLLICDNCEKMWHTYCVGLQDIPIGAWFCETCRAQRSIDPRPQTGRRTARTAGRRTAGERRRHRDFRDPHDESWNEVWGHVWSSINLDLDFPYNDDDATAAHMRRDRQRMIRQSREAHGAFERRLEIARFAGAGNSFRQAESAFANDSALRSSRSRRNNPTAPQPRAMDPEEASAWAAFDQARAASAEPPASRRRKRKSRSASPVEEDSDNTPIVIKRRRTSQSAAPTPGEVGQSSRSRPSPRHLSPLRRPTLNDTAGPSFLQSLLQEVEESSHTSSRMNLPRPSPRNAGSPPAEHSSPRPSSPALSPSPSNHSSPRAMSATPPPLSASRPSSPFGLSSQMQPIYPTIEYSPIRNNSPPPQMNGVSEGSRGRPRVPSTNGVAIAQPRPRSRVPPFITTSPPPPATSPDEASPTRATLSLSAKSDVQKLVSTALKPHYNDQTISKDEYTTINRDVSRMLYDKIGDFDALATTDKGKWEQVALAEVDKAVSALKAQA